MASIFRGSFFLFIGLKFCFPVMAQVPVSEEPRHRPVFQNRYFRLLDVWLQPGDTTLYHIHSTPSLFIYLSSNTISTQIKGEGWVIDQTEAGKAWYRSFSPDTLVHRVCNPDTIPLHVNDIEILSSYNADSSSRNKPLPFPLMFENEKTLTYQLTNASFMRQIISGRGPMIAVVVSGDSVFFQNSKTNQSTEIKPGKFQYIDPGSSFYFLSAATGITNIVLFELK